MNQIKIGKFIADCRKQNKLTQMQLAEKLGITDRAVSKWETGKSLPDAAIMLELCSILKITVNDLLNGEMVKMEDYNKELEKNLIKTIKLKEQADKRLLTLEVFVGILCITILLALIVVASYVQMEEGFRLLLILIGMIPLLIAFPFLLKIEQTAGYYKCSICGHKYVPTFKSVFLSMHMGRTRYMQCPKCHKKSWQKKVLTKN